MKINELIPDFRIWTTNEEHELLQKLQRPIKLSSLSEHEQFRIQAMIRKDLVTKSGKSNDPTIVSNEDPKEQTTTKN